MHKHRCVASCTPRRSSSEALWITDDILADAFRRFTSVYVRHGSNVPGPLEFRKRANRRRNTNLAHLGAPPAIDPAILFANKPEQNWWTSNTLASSHAKQPGFPALPRLSEAPEQHGEKSSPARTSRELHDDSQNSLPKSSGLFLSSHSQKSLNSLDRAEHGSSAASSLFAQPSIANSDPNKETTPVWQAQSVEQSTPTQTKTAEQSWPNESPELSSRDCEPAAPIERYAHNEEVDFETQLLQCRSVKDLEVLLRQHGLDFKLDKKQHLLIFEHAQTWNVTEFARYLTSPHFHPPGCGHFSLLAEGLYEEPAQPHFFMHQRDGRTIVFGAVCQAVRSGLVSANEWTQVVDAIFSRLTATKSRRARAASAAIRDLVLSYEQCSTLAVTSLDREWFQSFVDNLKKRAAYTAVLETLWRLSQWQSMQDIASMAEVYSLWLQSRPQARVSETPTRLLVDLPREVLLQVIGRISTQLLVSTEESDSLFSQQRKWSIVLDSFGGLGVTADNLTMWDAENLKLGISGNAAKTAQLTAFLWILHNINKPQRATPSVDQSWSLSDVFDLHELPSEAQSVRLYNQILAKATTMRIAHKASFVEGLPRLFASLKRSTAPPPQKSLLTVVQASLSELMHNQKYMKACEEASERFTDLTQALNLDMDTFQTLIRTLVVTNKLNFRFITRALKSNRHFRTALARSWPTRDSPGSEAQLYLDVTPQQALDTIHILAVACALSPAISSRQAFDKVKWCQDFLLDCKAPVEAPITRALWHAGVTRCGDGCSDKRLRWIMRQVVRVEGVHVAGRLLESSGFRQHRATIIQSMNVDAEQPHADDATFSTIKQELRQSSLSSKTLSKISTLPLEVARIAAAIESQAIAFDQQERKQIKEKTDAQRATISRWTRENHLMSRGIKPNVSYGSMRSSPAHRNPAQIQHEQSELSMRRVLANVPPPAVVPSDSNVPRIEYAPGSPGMSKRCTIAEDGLTSDEAVVLKSEPLYADEAYDEHKRAAANGNWTWQAGGVMSARAAVDDHVLTSHAVLDQAELEGWLEGQDQPSHTNTPSVKSVGQLKQSPGIVAEAEDSLPDAPHLKTWVEERRQPVDTPKSPTKSMVERDFRLKTTAEQTTSAKTSLTPEPNPPPLPQTDGIYLDLSATFENPPPPQPPSPSSAMQQCTTTDTEPTHDQRAAAGSGHAEWVLDETAPGKYNRKRQWVSLKTATAQL